MAEYLRRYLKCGAKSGRIINLGTDAAHAHTANISYRLVHDIGVHPRRINEIVHGARAVGADTSLRLSRDFGSSERYWLNLQARYGLEVEKDRLEGCPEQEVRVFSGAAETQAVSPSL